MKTVSNMAGAGSAPGELARLTAQEMLDGYRSGSFDPVEVIDDTIATLKAVDESCNILVADLFETARAAAEKSVTAYREGNAGPMEGIPVSIKDLIFVAGAPAKGGAPSLADYVPAVDAHVVSKLKEAGAIPTCKTTTCESGYKLTADSPVTGITRNPWNPERTSGGSSGGAAAGVAAGAGPIAIGTDGVGSIRVPSSFCGVFGLKPTYGLVSRAPGFFPPSWGSLAHTGPIARSVADAELTLKTIAGYDVRDAASLDCWAPGNVPVSEKPLRIAVSQDFGYAAVDPAVRALFKSTVDVLMSADFEHVSGGLDLDPEILTNVLQPIALTEQAASLGERTDADFAASDPDFLKVIEAGRKYSGTDYMSAAHRRSKLRGQFVEFFKTADILLTPTVAVPAFAAGTLGVSEIDGRKVDNHLGWSPFTWPINLVGLPAASVPCGMSPDGLPVGLQIIAPWGKEQSVLQVAKTLERLQPWSTTFPDLP